MAPEVSATSGASIRAYDKANSTDNRPNTTSILQNMKNS